VFLVGLGKISQYFSKIYSIYSDFDGQIVGVLAQK